MTLADAGRVDFTFTIKSVTYTTTKSVTFGVIITDPCSTTVYTIDPIAEITAIIPASNIIERNYVVTNTCAWAPLSLTPSKTYMSYDSSKISIDRSLMTLADVGRVDFTFTIKSVTYMTT